MSRKLTLSALLLLTFHPLTLRAETGRGAWLRYAPLEEELRHQYASLPNALVLLGDSPIVHNAASELSRGLQSMLNRSVRTVSVPVAEPAIIMATFADLHTAAPDLTVPATLRDDGFWIASMRIRGFDCIAIASPSSRGVLYGAFALLSKIARGESVTSLNEVQQPTEPLRWADEWDNLDGSIERGYAGRSIFFENGSVRADLTRAAEYARLLASIGINGCNINNVNADPRILSDDFLPQLARVADAFRGWGVRLSISVDVSSPKSVGGLDTFDPLDPRVAAWWREKADQIYRQIPDFAGFTVKADSEGRPGPSAYGRTPADAANVIAGALQPDGGVLFYRAFVYNHHLDWRDAKADRARAAYDIFHPLDGKFDDNVIVQIKNGPIDFQVREPVSPLFGGLEKTNQAAELQVTQEYTGQQRHVCFLVPMWKEALDFDLHPDSDGTSATAVKEIIAGKTFHRPTGGIVAVVNVGLDENWLAHPLAVANLYGFGRLAWNPNLDAKTIADEWTRLTFGNNPKAVNTITTMLMTSRHTYEEYTGPLGAGTLTHILGSHYGPGVESSERNGWGQWHRADHDGIGMDRTVATGTGYVGQYSAPVAKVYESLATTPDELLLFFHHVPYTYRLHSGKTVIQHIYDSHYEGARQAREYVSQWESLKGLIDEGRYAAVLARLEYQAGHAIVWRDAVCNWFLRASGIPDAKGRVGHHPDRVEAESMSLRGYVPVDVIPWEDASGGKAIECKNPEGCSAAFAFTGAFTGAFAGAFTRAAGNYDIAVQYFDQNNGESKFQLLVNGRTVDKWIANDNLPAKKIGADASTRRWIRGVALRPGDEIRIEGIPDGEEHAALDYVVICPASRDSATGDSTDQGTSTTTPAPVHLTAEQDHQRLLGLLHINSLRPGPSGDPKSPNAANVYESKVAPYTLPDPLVLKSGHKVTTAKQWWTERRPEIVEDFDREVYGRVPPVTPKVNWEVTSATNETVGSVAMVTKKLLGHVDNSSYPAITVDLQLTLSTPAKATGPVPVIMEFSFSPEMLEAIKKRLTPEQLAAFVGGGPTWQEQVAAKGWGYAILIPTSYQADKGDGLTEGIIGLVNRGQSRKLDDWGALRAWAWGASRALDYFETDKSVDAKQVGIEGLSRYGKAALVAMAYDPRFAIGFIGSSGAGGAKILRRNFGEQVENLAATSEYHWFAGNFLKYAGPLTANDLPVDAHELIALCAPRPVFISSGSQQVEGGWVDARGMFLAAVGAGPVYRLLGKRGLGTSEFPPMETPLISGDIGFRQHKGGHTTGPNWPTFLEFAGRYLHAPQQHP